ncbi:MAG: NapC/NirT family cytochrome c [Peptococcaceae bacterium]|nr:NapC/NirT family cytochrome c [Peptococcaceae bacterium]
MKQSDQGQWDYTADGGEGGKQRRKRRSKRVGLLILCLVVCGILLTGIYKYNAASHNPEFCVSCHEMQASYDAWKTTSHSRANCVDCHTNISLANFAYKHFMGVNRVNTLQVSVADTSCLKCHSDARVITPPQDLLVPHNLHVQMGLSCTQCHRTVAHGQVVKAVTVNLPGQSGPLLQGENLFDPNRIPMDGCMKCHNGSMATSNCNACHADKTPPASHKTANFATAHGYVALGNVAACNSCHQYDASLQLQYKPQGNGWTDVQSFARKTDFCVECHSKRPSTHRSFYTVSHGPAATANINACLTCHNYDEKGKVPEKPASSVTCAQCHYNQHPTDWLQIHPKQVNKDNQAKCFACHDASSCNDCHNKTFRAR